MKKLIIDVDTGVDDAHAIMLALAAEDVQIVAITCVNGNTTLENVVRNTLRVLRVCQRSDVPVYRGCDRTRTGQPSPETCFHGKDGMGDSESDQVDFASVGEMPAAEAMVKIAEENQGEVTLFAAGPLTNVAKALDLDPDFGRKLKDCTIMGGNTTGLGNFKVCGEFNFACDPEAAKYVLERLKCPISVISLEPCIEHGVPVEWFQQWADVPTDIGRFNKRIVGLFIRNILGMGRTTICSYDAIAIATVLDSRCVLASERYHCTVETMGEFTRGMMVVDWRGHLGREANVNLVTKLDVERFKNMMMNAISRDN